MSSVAIIFLFNCGCGFKTDNMRQAEDHVRSSSHSMTIHGRIIAQDRDEMYAEVAGR